ncbi:hypothetical protein ABFS82_05G118800 [Erythranthe guttata]|uniref:Uncharacterized protein n=1 Tax=Erythranthe guttata TaxID=4155 RepID=A0A022QK88_ERYGU|nr:hypothetical protein MIMGU_mgv1a017256mg [Erythranthe guttata]
MKPWIAAFLFAMLVTSSGFFELTAAIQCSPKCEVRCSKASAKENCLKYCGICCAKCQCVPSGTYGNKDECPCYRDMKNSKGNPKCP